MTWKYCYHNKSPIIVTWLEGFGIRLNKKKPRIKIEYVEKGGLGIIKNTKTLSISDETIKLIAREYKLISANIYFNDDCDIDDLIDVIEGNRVYVPCLYVLNKIDKISMEELNILDKIPHYVPISGFNKWNFDELLETIWDYLDLVRVYTKPRG